jgi:F0F1-type ATP synthase assembly protein I
MQIGVGAALALGSLALGGRRALMSALIGAATAVVANGYMMSKALRPVSTAGVALGQLYMGQLVKVAVTVAAFLWAARMPNVSWLALMSAYVGTLSVSWWLPLMPPRAKLGAKA